MFLKSLMKATSNPNKMAKNVSPIGVVDCVHVFSPHQANARLANRIARAAMNDETNTERFYQIAETLSPGSEPIVIQRAVEPDARLNECYSNCQSKVNKSGGAMQCGWVFHKGTTYLVAIS